MKGRSARKTKANRRNALASTGPRTAAGKAAAAVNATKHGLLSRLEVLPHVETPGEWEDHLARTLEDLRPSGYLERVLAERVAVNLWRLRRVVRFERDAAAVVLERTASPPDVDAEDPLARILRTPKTKDPEAVKAGMEVHEMRADLARRLPGLPDAEKVEPTLAAALVLNTAERADVDLWGDEETKKEPDIDLPDYPDGVELEEVDWTAGLLRKCLSAIVDHAGRKLEDLLAEDVEGATEDTEKARKELAELERGRSHLLRRAALPDRDELEKVNRYEVSIERSLFRNLHELQRLQASRAGETVPPPAVLDVDVAGGLPATAG